MRKLLLGVLTVAVVAVPAIADSWKFEQSTTIYRFSHGLRFEKIVDPIRGGDWARFTVKILNGAVVLGRYEGLGFEELYASPGENYFVGLSNSGLPGTAVVVFDNRGEILLLAAHDVAEFDYCDKSIYVQRRWHDSEKGDVQFGTEHSVSEITLRNCRGERINLLQAVAEAYQRAGKAEKTG